MGHEFGYEHTVNSHINRLRTKIEPDLSHPKYILTTWGVMKKFREGDLTARVHVKSTGDVKQLADIFNEMADILTTNMEKLKEVKVLRRELIANVSHDLRTPISIIHGYVETLQMKHDVLPDAADQKHYMNIILESTGKLEKLVNELFELSKL